METRLSRSKKNSAKQGKRKALQSPSARKTGSSPRAAKSSKPNSPAATQVPSRDRQIQDNIEKSRRLLDDLEKMAAACISSKQGQCPLEGHENLRETMCPSGTPEELIEACNTIQIFRQKFNDVASKIGSVEKEVKTELETKAEDKTNAVEKTNEIDRIREPILDQMRHFNDEIIGLMRVMDGLMKHMDNITVERRRERAELHRMNFVSDELNLATADIIELSAEILEFGSVKKQLKKKLKNKLNQCHIQKQNWNALMERHIQEMERWIKSEKEAVKNILTIIAIAVTATLRLNDAIFDKLMQESSLQQRELDTRHEYEISNSNTTLSTTLANAEPERREMHPEPDPLHERKEWLRRSINMALFLH